MIALGFALFLLVGLMAFWTLAFVLGVAVPMWLTIGALHIASSEEINRRGRRVMN